MADIDKPSFGIASGRYDAGIPCDVEPSEESEPVAAPELRRGQSIAFEDGLQARRCIDAWFPSRPRLPL